MQLYALLESIEQYVTGLGEIFVIIRSSNSSYSQAYQVVKNRFKTVQFVTQTEPYTDLKQLTIECFSKTNNKYVVLGR